MRTLRVLIGREIVDLETSVTAYHEPPFAGDIYVELRRAGGVSEAVTAAVLRHLRLQVWEIGEATLAATPPPRTLAENPTRVRLRFHSHRLRGRPIDSSRVGLLWDWNGTTDPSATLSDSAEPVEPSSMPTGAASAPTARAPSSEPVHEILVNVTLDSEGYLWIGGVRLLSHEKGRKLPLKAIGTKPHRIAEAIVLLAEERVPQLRPVDVRKLNSWIVKSRIPHVRFEAPKADDGTKVRVSVGRSRDDGRHVRLRLCSPQNP